MENKDEKRFLEIMTALSELYEINLSKVMLEIWFKALQEFPIDSVAKSAFGYMKNPDTGRFKPKPADIIKMISGSTSDAACLAWTKVDKAVRMIGDYQTVVFDDPVVHKVITDMGGWIGFGDGSEDEWPFKAKDFQQRYRIYMSRGESKDAPSKLAGQHEHSQIKEGYDPPEPILIGDKVKAKLVLENKQEVKPIFSLPEK